MGDSPSLKDLFQVLKKRISIIIVITLLAASVSAFISYFVLTPIYETSTQLLVNQKKSNQNIYNNNEVQTNLQLMNTYNVIIKSTGILDKVKKELGLNMSVEELSGKITVASEKESQVLNLSVKDKDPDRAVKIANKTARVFKREIPKIMSVDNISILSKSQIGDGLYPVDPKPKMNIMLGIIVGLLSSIGLVFLLEYLDNSIKNEQDIENILDLPILGTVNRVKK
jgi:capsular polysaccharide biosynthesis protein